MICETSGCGTGFRCANPACDKWVGDPWYVGPAGHAPQNLCFDCWLAHWDLVEARAINGGEWTDLDEALWLVCHGVGVSEAAGLVGRHRNTLRIWIGRMRRNPELIPDWLIRAASPQQGLEV